MIALAQASFSDRIIHVYVVRLLLQYEVFCQRSVQLDGRIQESKAEFLLLDGPAYELGMRIGPKNSVCRISPFSDLGRPAPLAVLFLG